MNTAKIEVTYSSKGNKAAAGEEATTTIFSV